MPVNFSKNISLGLQPQDKSSRNSLFEVGLLVIICVLFFWFVVLPKKAEVAQKNAALTKALAQQTLVDGELSTLQNLIASLPSNADNLTQLSQAMPLDGNTVRLQLLVQNLAESVGVTVGSISISGSPNGVAAGNTSLLANPYGVTRSVQALNGSLYVSGSFNQLLALLKKFEQSGRLIDVGSIAITQGSVGSLNMSVTFKAYYFAP
jgi:Tfp pilus assembly protein PilO